MAPESWGPLRTDHEPGSFAKFVCNTDKCYEYLSANSEMNFF